MPEYFGVLFGRCIVDTVLLGLSLHVAHDVLRPLFGSSVVQNLIPTITSTCVLIMILLPNSNRVTDAYLTAFYSLFPVVSHRLALWATRLNDPQAATIFALGFPLSLISFSAAGSWKRLSSDFAPSIMQRSIRVACGIILLLIVLALRQAWASFPFTPLLNPSSLLIAFSWVHALFPTFSSSSASRNPPKARPRSKNKVSEKKRAWMVYILPALCTSLALFTAPARPLSLPYTHPNAPLRVLSSIPSVTGRIVVGEELKHGLRYLRADHSILGGVWIGKHHLRRRMDTDDDMGGLGVVTDAKGEPLGDSIYTAFVLQEAARLQARARPAKNALIMYVNDNIYLPLFPRIDDAKVDWARV